MKTCAFCGWRDAVGLAELDGRLFASCLTCNDTASVDTRRISRTEIAAVIRSLGKASTADVALSFGGQINGTEIEQRRYQAVRQALHQMRRCGQLESVSKSGQRSLYRLTGKPIVDGRRARYSSEQGGSVDLEAA